MSLAPSLSNDESARTQNALERYLAELVRLYPPAAAHRRVEPWLGHERSYLVSIDPPPDETAWMELSEALSVIATDLSVETGCLFVLTTLE
jgi:hypothetical protein